jgi:hypothetical protein
MRARPSRWGKASSTTRLSASWARAAWGPCTWPAIPSLAAWSPSRFCLSTAARAPGASWPRRGHRPCKLVAMCRNIPSRRATRCPSGVVAAIPKGHPVARRRGRFHSNGPPSCPSAWLLSSRRPTRRPVGVAFCIAKARPVPRRCGRRSSRRAAGCPAGVVAAILKANSLPRWRGPPHREGPPGAPSAWSPPSRRPTRRPVAFSYP